jgi:catechol O-methyltransferase
MKVNIERLSSSLFAHERELLLHVVDNAEEGDVDGILHAMNSFWDTHYSSEGTSFWSNREKKIDDIMRSKSPSLCLEIGTYCGSSTIRIARQLPEDGMLLSVEVDPLFAAIATKILEHARLSHKVKVLIGTVDKHINAIADECKRSPNDSVNFILCDHFKEQFIPDLQLLEGRNLVGAGTVVMGDMTIYPGDQESEQWNAIKWKDYMKAHPKMKFAQSEVGGITVSEWVHLP